MIRKRGEDYFQRNRVRLTEVDPVDPGRVLAFVQGTRRYTVQLDFVGSEVNYACSCPYFFDRGIPCKHLWAVLLKLEQSGFFRRWEEARFAKLVEPEGVSERLWEYGEEELDEELRGDSDRRRPGGRSGGRVPLGTNGSSAVRTVLPEWKAGLNRIRQYRRSEQRGNPGSWPAEREILYVFDIPRTLSAGRATVHLHYRDGKGKPRPISGSGMRIDDLWQLPGSEDREILGVLRGGSYQNVFDEEAFGYRLLGQDIRLLCPSYILDVDLVRLLLPRMAAGGRLFLKLRRGSPGEPDPVLWENAVVWDEGAPWELRLVLTADSESSKLHLEGRLARGDQSMALSVPELLLAGGLMFARGTLARYSAEASFAWISMLRKQKHLTVARQHLPEFFSELLAFPDLCVLEIDNSVGIRTESGTPQPRLRVSKADRVRHSSSGGGLIGELSFAYGDHVLTFPSEGSGRYIEQDNLVVFRNRQAEGEALERIQQLGFRRIYEYRSRDRVLKLAARRLPEVVDRLLDEGWQVEAEGRLLRSASAVDVHVVSKIDWFELRGGVRFGEVEMSLPQLLKVLRKGENTVRLGDGSFGVLPEQWLRQQGFLLALGEVQSDHLRFHSSQALLVDLLLQQQPQASCDEVFANLRAKLKDYGGIEPLDAPPGFVGSLRGYQREGLGWFEFLDEFGFGGCLADDMGLGKTVQVLALLERRCGASRQHGASANLRESKRRRRASRSTVLVVVPRSLVFNWKQEAARFTPQLMLLEHTGPKRRKDTGRFGKCDVVLTTYGTMRNDISWLKDYEFDYIILDEAQVIKNAGSLTAKAARLLQGRRRLALSGTPIENHLGELWSLFEFLNPGMLGGVSFFKRQLAGRESLGEDSRGLLSRYLKPFILRRTKEQVAPELPDKVEQTLFCELEPGERRRYAELKRYYQRSLQQRIESEGLGRAKIQILEALLRLRQAACHPGLLNPAEADRPSTKLDLLLQQLEDIVAEERKALVFSQFTSLLRILRSKLDQLGMDYEYLDGRTRKRERHVQRFQEDPGCRLFLISLKAGGLGLNLTAAEYVFLLDPWWNPASEAQAIDRTHRIGQSKKVFAYRLIAKDTVEEKVLELQQTKRELAEAIISRDNRLIGELSREDLALLLS